MTLPESGERGDIIRSVATDSSGTERGMLKRVLADAAVALRTALWGRPHGRAHDPQKPAMPIPPEDKIFVDGKNFEAVGEEFLGHFRTLGGLKPGDDVLDIGSGI